MVRIAPVALQDNPRLLWLDPRDLDIREGDTVIVHTEKGLDFGVSKDIIEVGEDQVKRLRSRLRPVERIADDRDLARIRDLRQKGRDALPRFKQLAAETNEDMHPVMVEYLFDGDRAIFFFEAEERVDFRDLVRKLANEFHVRVDMRQVGVRDEARLVGGLGHCGQELCCRRLGGDFNPVSIRMAKEQDLSLNPQKISGVCGRLMCCLRYEYDAYKDFHSRAPKQNGRIETPHGTAKVVSLDVPREQVTVRVERGDKNVTFPLSAMDPVPEDAENKRPTSIGEAFDEYANPDPFGASVAFGAFDTAGFTRESKLGTAQAHHNPASKRNGVDAGGSSSEHRKPRRRRGNGGKPADQARQQHSGRKGKPQGGDSAQPGKDQPSHRRRCRRPAAIQQGQAPQGAPRQPRQDKPKGQQPAGRPRPGQKSSGLSHGQKPSSHAEGAPAGVRRKRRRSHHTGTTTGSEGE
ncbi:PSP1 domain-containing protein [Curtanaerobium respiraculi]|uniref:PSP1 domain-containing protein n=1 Tax=Curtanaerobium respiraculi TaxID=2949669 RepID=UPI0024B35EB8|nr:regulatory iron-sulfur-containing complex subunit RicT [Curtanaerobium respiraculi]